MSPSSRGRRYALLLLMTPVLLHAQERRLDGVLPLHVSVRVTYAHVAGDTTTLDYAVENVRPGGEDLWGLLVSMPATVVRMPAPTRLHWGIHPSYRHQPIVGWMLYEDTLIGPGKTTPPLRVMALGIPDVVRYWAVPDFEANPPAPSFDEEPPARDYYMAFSDSGVTVGVVPVPPGASPASLTARLHLLLGRSCGDLGWISQAGVCHSLDVKLTHAEEALASGQTADVRETLTAFVAELDAQHGAEPGKHVNDGAHALLAANAAYILSRL